MELRSDAVETSVIIPVGKRHSEIAALYREYRNGLMRLATSYEVIFVLDGPRKSVAESLERLQREGERIIVISLTKPFGEATALTAGFEQASGQTIITLPSYFQIDAAEIPRLTSALANAHLAVARRWPRFGGKLDSWRRRTFHNLVRWVTGSKFQDLGCSARAMKRIIIDEISLYGDQHRFLPLLASRQGFRVVEVDLRQSPNDRYLDGYPMREYAHRALDILTVLFLVRFTKRPLRFFGMIGVATFGLGALLIATLVTQRLFFAVPLSDRPALLLASLLAVLGLQLFALGLLGELIIFTHARGIKDYQVDTVVQFPPAAPREKHPFGVASRTAAN
jgi:glycosyltransferase involved in cell wall biosynthesis